MKISEAQIKKLTDLGSWQRGINYYEQGNVLSILEDKGTIIAKVAGTRDYKVELMFENDQLKGLCTCPMGDMGVFCKHCVAVGLMYMESASSDESASSKNKIKTSEPIIALNRIREYLSQKQTGALVEIIIDQLKEDDSLRERLMMEVACLSKKEPDVSALKKTRKKIKGIDFKYGEDLYNAMFENMEKLTKKSKVQAKEWYFDSFYPQFAKMLSKKYSKRPGLDHVLDKLINNNIKIAILSDYSYIKERLESLEIDENYFDVLSSSEDMGALKPAVRPFLEVAAKLDKSPSRVLVVGDREDTDGEGAASSKMGFLQLREKRKINSSTYTWGEFYKEIM